MGKLNEHAQKMQVKFKLTLKLKLHAIAVSEHKEKD
jgi:hypothetical protein